MGGRGNLGNTRFKNTTKESVLKAFAKQGIRLMKDGKPISTANDITNKELATLSALSEIDDLKHIKVLDITNRKDKPITAVNVVRNTSKGEVKIPTIYVNRNMARKGYNYMNKKMKEQGYRNGVSSFTLKREKPKKARKGNPRVKTAEEKALDLFNSYGLK